MDPGTALQIYIGALSFPAHLIYSSGFEYYLHKNHMHKKWNVWKWLDPYWNYPFYMHHVKHHGNVQADNSFNRIELQKGDEITMAWWNWIVLIPLASLPFWLLAWLLRLISAYAWGSPASFIGIPLSAMLALLLYYFVYESNHHLMHRPATTGVRAWYQRTALFKDFCARHLIHHKWYWLNYNVVWALYDRWLKTLRKRSRTNFIQAGHPAPDVQPEHASRPGHCLE